jgi:hypothetical protein
LLHRGYLQCEPASASTSRNSFAAGPKVSDACRCAPALSDVGSSPSYTRAYSLSTVLRVSARRSGVPCRAPSAAAWRPACTGTRRSASRRRGHASRTRDVIVEENLLGLAVLQGLSAHRPRSQYGSPSIWEDHGKTAGAIRRSPTPHLTVGMSPVLLIYKAYFMTVHGHALPSQMGNSLGDWGSWVRIPPLRPNTRRWAKKSLRTPSM